MSSVGGARLGQNSLVRVPATTLSALLAKHHVTRVDFLSLDVEGYELEVLKGLNFTRWQPSFMCIEIYKQDLAAIKAYLHKRGYRLVVNLVVGPSKNKRDFVD